MACTKEIKLCG